jgi:CheY-like chemotaxis protein
MISTDPILLVEDDEIDQFAVRRAFKELQIANPLFIAENGVVALDHLSNSVNQSPCLILLDLNMPQMNGVEFLKHRQKSDVLKLIPVVVLTTSTQDSDLIESYNLGVAGYMAKPVDHKQFMIVVKAIHAYWVLSKTPQIKPGVVEVLN